MEADREEFIIPDGNYTRETFQQRLIEDQTKLFLPSKKHKWIKIHSVRTVPNGWKQLLSGHVQRELGDVWHINLPIPEDNTSVVFYVTEYSPELLLFYSASTNWEYEHSLERFIQETKGFGQMWIGPNKFEDLILRFMDRFDPTIERFFARRRVGDMLSTKTDRDASRRIDWGSDDGGPTIWELKEIYGIRPTAVRMRLREGQMQLKNDGMFVLTRLNQKMFEAFEDAMNFIKKDESIITTTSQRVRLSFEHSGDKGKIVLPGLTSGLIILKQARLHNALVDRIRANSRFDFIESVAQEGSFSWIATAIDRQKQSIFGISSDEQVINLIPRFGVTFESFLEFYRQILEKVDSTAVFQTPGGVIG